MKKICPVCNQEFEGRSDKKFCCDQCRNTYNNNKYADFSNQTRNINRILKSNRKILSDFFAKGVTKLNKERLLKAGYNFDYLQIFILQEQEILIIIATTLELQILKIIIF